MFIIYYLHIILFLVSCWASSLGTVQAPHRHAPFRRICTGRPGEKPLQASARRVSGTRAPARIQGSVCHHGIRSHPTGHVFSLEVGSRMLRCRTFQQGIRSSTSALSISSLSPRVARHLTVHSSRRREAARLNSALCLTSASGPRRTTSSGYARARS